MHRRIDPNGGTTPDITGVTPGLFAEEYVDPAMSMGRWLGSGGDIPPPTTRQRAFAAIAAC